tara:strand:+ start:540 stop:1058 length:519 start_codon:yes stop_codon:yes gene_type:complete
MSSYHQSHQKRYRSRDSLERRVDKLFETGRQFVDGVAGNRPGQRRTNHSISDGLDNVGRWVGDKLDWFFEEEDDWIEPWQLEQHESNMNLSNKKRPLTAISLRGIKAIKPSAPRENIADEENLWPDESSFRVNRWERQEGQDVANSRTVSRERSESQRINSRPLPRSSRRRS